MIIMMMMMERPSVVLVPGMTPPLPYRVMKWNHLKLFQNYHILFHYFTTAARQCPASLLAVSDGDDVDSDEGDVECAEMVVNHEATSFIILLLGTEIKLGQQERDQATDNNMMLMAVSGGDW